MSEQQRTVRRILCERSKKLLAEHGVNDAGGAPPCDGDTVVCGHCEHTTYRILSALMLPPGR